MLSDGEFAAWARTAKLDAEAVDLIRTIRTSEPRRRVRSGRKNVSGRYPSGKMGRTIQFESHTVELPFIYQFEHDDDVLEYWDQPAVPVKVVYRDGGKKRTVGIAHTADFFLLTRSGAAWIECKREEELARLAARTPRYQRTDGGWECEGADAYAKQYGLRYRVLSSAAINRTLVANLALLEDYFRVAPTVDHAKAIAVGEWVRREPGIDLARLRESADVDIDTLYSLLAAGMLFVDLERVALSRPADCAVFALREQSRAAVSSPHRLPSAALPVPIAMEVGTRLEWDGSIWEVINAGREKLTLRQPSAESDAVVEVRREQAIALAARGAWKAMPMSDDRPAAVGDQRLLTASPTALAVANHRWTALSGAGDEAPGVAGRTLRRWRAAYRAAEAAGASGFEGLLPRARGGNGTPRLDPRVERLIDELAKGEWATPTAPSMQSIYERLAAACAAQRLTIPTPRTVRRRLRLLTGHAVRRARHGAKGAYTTEPFHWSLTAVTPRHGERPFAIAHLDHTRLDVEVVDEKTGRNLGRPWVTFLSDAYSRRLLAIWLAFDPPSYRACMMAIRICVARHRRLPQTLVVDGGAEFHGVYFESLLARFHVTQKTRPAGKPRFGSVLERLFGSANTALLHQLPGNTKVMRNVRQRTAEVDPRRLARWDLASLYEALCRWGYEVYDELEHPALGESPRAAFLAGLDRHGYREQRTIAYDETFVLSTLPTTAKGTAKIDPVRGVRINYVSYWNEVFAEPRLAHQEVHVRFDPFDARHAFAYVNGQWVQAISGELIGFAAVSTAEVVTASAVLRRQRALHAGGERERAIQMGRYLASEEAQRRLTDQRARDAAGRQVLALAERGVSAAPVALSASVPTSPTRKRGAPANQRAATDAAEEAAVTIFEAYG